MSDAAAYLRELAERGYDPADESRFLAAWAALEEAYFERLSAVCRRRDPWIERFRAGAEETVRLVEAHLDEARFLVVDALAMGEAGRRCQQGMGDRVTALIDTAREELDDPGSAPSATGRWIFGVFLGRIYRRLAYPHGPGLTQQLPELRFLAVSSYFGTDAGLAELLSTA